MEKDRPVGQKTGIKQQHITEKSYQEALKVVRGMLTTPQGSRTIEDLSSQEKNEYVKALIIVTEGPWAACKGQSLTSRRVILAKDVTLEHEREALKQDIVESNKALNELKRVGLTKDVSEELKIDIDESNKALNELKKVALIEDVAKELKKTVDQYKQAVVAMIKINNIIDPNMLGSESWVNDCNEAAKEVAKKKTDVEKALTKVSQSIDFDAINALEKDEASTQDDKIAQSKKKIRFALLKYKTLFDHPTIQLKEKETEIDKMFNNMQIGVREYGASSNEVQALLTKASNDQKEFDVLTEGMDIEIIFSEEDLLSGIVDIVTELREVDRMLAAEESMQEFVKENQKMIDKCKLAAIIVGCSIIFSLLALIPLLYLWFYKSEGKDAEEALKAINQKLEAMDQLIHVELTQEDIGAGTKILPDSDPES